MTELELMHASLSAAA